jgi:hypothetical protein
MLSPHQSIHKTFATLHKFSTACLGKSYIYRMQLQFHLTVVPNPRHVTFVSLLARTADAKNAVSRIDRNTKISKSSFNYLKVGKQAFSNLI